MTMLVNAKVELMFKHILIKSNTASMLGRQLFGIFVVSYWHFYYKKWRHIACKNNKGQLWLSFVFSLAVVTTRLVTHLYPWYAYGRWVIIYYFKWLASDTHIDLIENHHKDSREYDTSAITRSSLFVDSN